MGISSSDHVVILYENALLGEGISRYVYTHTGVQAALAHLDDGGEVRTALSLIPALVVVQANEFSQPLQLPHLDSDTVLIDVTLEMNESCDVLHKNIALDRIVKIIQGIKSHQSDSIIV